MMSVGRDSPRNNITLRPVDLSRASETRMFSFAFSPAGILRIRRKGQAVAVECT
jgi:hypothetical protein